MAVNRKHPLYAEFRCARRGGTGGCFLLLAWVASEAACFALYGGVLCVGQSARRLWLKNQQDSVLRCHQADLGKLVCSHTTHSHTHRHTHTRMHARRPYKASLMASRAEGWETADAGSQGAGGAGGELLVEEVFRAGRCAWRWKCVHLCVHVCGVFVHHAKGRSWCVRREGVRCWLGALFREV